jgi:hypothetical protein
MFPQITEMQAVPYGLPEPQFNKIVVFLFCDYQLLKGILNKCFLEKM